MKIKEFIGNDAKAAVLGNPEEACRILADVFGYKTKLFTRQEIRNYFAYSAPDMWFYREAKNEDWNECLILMESLTRLHFLELATIEKVGADAYGRALRGVVPSVISENTDAMNTDSLEEWVESLSEKLDKFAARFATADAPTRVAAMLTALADFNK